MLLFLTITLAGNLAFSQADRFELLLLSRIVMGFGSSVIYINAIKLIERWLPLGKLAMGLGVLSAASPLGDFLSLFGLPNLYMMLDAWRPVYLGFCGVMMGVVVLDAFFIRDPPKAGEAEAGQSLGVFESLRGVASTGALLPLFVGYFVSGFSWCFWS